MYLGLLRSTFSARWTMKSSPPATCMAAMAAITDMMIRITSTGMLPGLMPKTSASTSTPKPPAKPMPMLPRRAPSQIKNNTTSSSTIHI
jgi:hypothetical protein